MLVITVLKELGSHQICIKCKQKLNDNNYFVLGKFWLHYIMFAMTASYISQIFRIEGDLPVSPHLTYGHLTYRIDVRNNTLFRTFDLHFTVGQMSDARNITKDI